MNTKAYWKLDNLYVFLGEKQQPLPPFPNIIEAQGSSANGQSRLLSHALMAAL